MICPLCLALLQQAIAARPKRFSLDFNIDDIRGGAGLGCYICYRHGTLVDFSSRRDRDRIYRGKNDEFQVQAVWYGPSLMLRCKFDDFKTFIEVVACSSPVVPSTVGHNDVNSQEIVAEETPVSTSDSTVLKLIQKWLSKCRNHHPECSAKKSSQVPSRLIDLKPSDLPPGHWRLIDTTDKIGEKEYTTLSHRWGREQPLKLTNESFHSMTKGLSLSAFSGLYLDTIRLIITIGVRYAWIDSICVLQDEGLDIQKEASKMADVYANAFCNIAALHASPETLFMDRGTDKVGTSAVYLDKKSFDLDQNYAIVDNKLWEMEVTESPLSHRGWILQEEILARRTIFFGERQVFWRCRQHNLCETYPGIDGHPGGAAATPVWDISARDAIHAMSAHIGQDNRMKNPTERTPNFLQGVVLGTKDPFDVWKAFVDNYSCRQLSHPEDKLLAIAGIVRHFARHRKDEYCAGLWEGDLPVGLLWEVRGLHSQRTRPEKYRAPSWSWAAIDAELYLPSTASYDLIVARVKHVNVENLGSEKFGSVRSASLTLQCPVLQIRLGGPEFFNYLLDAVTDKVDTSISVAIVRVGLSSGNNYISGLLLSRVKESSPVKYQRIGICNNTNLNLLVAPPELIRVIKEYRERSKDRGITLSSSEFDSLGLPIITVI